MNVSNTDPIIVDQNITEYSFREKMIVKLISAFGSISCNFNFKGFWHASNLIGKLADRNRLASAKLGSSSVFHFRLRDPYWNRLLSRKYQYEKEISDAFSILSKIDKVIFLDCGANYGYWSLLAADKSVSFSHVYAIEASRLNYKYLSINNDANGGIINTINKAIYSISGEILSFSDDDSSHANSKIDKSGSDDGSVETISIDDIVEKYDAELPVLIKLDVEGAEIDALIGAETTLQRQCCIIYEDHGSDQDSRVTEWILKNSDYSVYWIGSDCEKIIKINSTEQLSPIKTNKKVGYNFFALKENSVFHDALIADKNKL